ncbi:MAG: thiamine pyrophosphate-binding protein [Minicystis sp.]
MTLSLPVSLASAPARPEPIPAAGAVVRALAELGVDTFYGIPGGAISPVYDAILDQPGLRVIHNRQETGAVFAAMGHRRSGGSLPCVLVTSGPGIINAITGLAAAHADGVPLIVLAGEVPRKSFGRGALQEGSRYGLDVLSMVRSVTKLAAEITHPRLAAAMIRKAVDAALSGRQGPVVLTLPLDVANDHAPMMSLSLAEPPPPALDPAAVQRFADALESARRGLILVGSGARDPGAARAVMAIASTLQMPVATTPKAKGVFPESHPLSLGVYGLAGHPSASSYLGAGVDTLLAIGCGFGENATNGWSQAIAASRAFLQIDIDPAQIGKNYAVDQALCGPAQTVLEAVAQRLRRGPAAQASFGVRYDDAEAMTADTTPLKPAHVVRRLQETFPRDTVFTVDIGEHNLFAVHYLKIDDPRRFLAAVGLGSMGSGVGAAVGAKLANPDKPVLAIVGDYGFQMQGSELAACVDHRIGAVFAIFNDSRMRMVESGMRRIYGRHVPMHAPAIDFAALARAVGAEGYNLRTPEDFDRLPADLAYRDLPVVLDIAIDPGASFATNTRVAHLRNFKA